MPSIVIAILYSRVVEAKRKCRTYAAVLFLRP